MYSRFRHIIAVIFYLVCSIFIVRTPLLGNFGFEFAVAFALLGSIFSGLSAVQDERKKINFPKPFLFWTGLGYNIIYLIIPLVIIFLIAIPRLPCDPVEGLSFYILLPFISVLFSYSIGWLIGSIFRWGRVVFLLFVVTTIIAGIIGTFIQPRIFFYNVFLGFFPGFSYDQLLPVTSTLISYRGFTVYLAALIILILYVLKFQSYRLLSWKEKIKGLREAYGRNILSIIITIGVLIIFVQFVSRGFLGWNTPRTFLETKLGEVFTTPSFTIYYSSESFTQEQIKWVALEHEFQRHQVAHALGVHYPKRIRSYIYPNPDVKKTLIGPARTNIAIPWSREIHINADRYDEILQHELAHIIAGEFGMRFLKISNSLSLTEGLATAVSGVWGNRSLHEHAASIIQFEIISNPGKLLRNKYFIMSPSPRSYVLMGSFVQYLKDRYGMERIQIAYPWSEFDRAFGRPPEQLIREWLEFINRIDVSERQRLKTEIHFLRPSLFTIDCPRSIARFNRKGMELLQDRNYEEAYHMFDRSFTLVPNATALQGKLLSSFYLGRFEEIFSVLEENTYREQFPQVIPTLYRVAGDSHVLLEEYDRAEEFYTKLKEIDFSRHMNEMAIIRLHALTSPIDQQVWSNLLLRKKVDFTEQLILLQDDEITIPVRWLAAQQHIEKEEFDDALFHLAILQETITELEQYTQFLLSLYVGKALFYSGRFQEAIMEFWNGLNFTDNPADTQLLEEWMDRCSYVEEFGSIVWEDQPPWDKY